MARDGVGGSLPWTVRFRPRCLYVLMNGRCRAGAVARGEQVEKSASKDSERERAVCLPFRCIPFIRRLCVAEHVEPVGDSCSREVGPGSVGIDQRPRIPLHPQREQSPMFLGREPAPQLLHHGGKPNNGVFAMGAAEPLQQSQLVLASATEQRSDQPIFGPEEVQQHSRAGPDSRRQGPQRQVGQAMLEDVAVGQPEQFLLPRRSLMGAHSIMLQ